MLRSHKTAPFTIKSKSVVSDLMAQLHKMLRILLASARLRCLAHSRVTALRISFSVALPLPKKSPPASARSRWTSHQGSRPNRKTSNKTRDWTKANLSFYKKTPQVGLEPTTYRLTVSLAISLFRGLSTF